MARTYVKQKFWSSDQEIAVRARLRDRMREIGVGDIELARRAEVGRTIVNDFMREASHSIRHNNLEQIARALGVSATWLLTGAEYAASDRSLATPATDRILHAPTERRVVSVSPAQEALLAFDSLNLTTGECVCRSETATVIEGRIVDPALALAGNVYAAALMNRRPQACVVKTEVLDGGKKVLVVLDSKS